MNVTVIRSEPSRLQVTAATSYQANVPQWGQSYTYDGFGNLTGQTVTQGSAPAFSAVYDPSTNHPAAGFGSVDANGNVLLYADGGIVAYDGRNRMIGVIGNYQYSYDPSNKRVWRGVWTNGTLTTDEVTFWSVSGQKLATYQMDVTQNVNPPVMYASQTGTNYYFGAKLIKNAGGHVGADRLGSIGHFYPWGQEKPSATQNGTEKFTGYFRDAETGLDYADQRYHVPGTGRFLTPDPYKSNGGGAGDSTNPISWNKYAYALGDPVRYRDPHGLFSCDGDYEDGDEDFTSSDCGLDESDITGPDTCGAGQHFEETIDTCVDDSSSEQTTQPTTPTCYDWTCMPGAFSTAIAALTLNQDCMNLFGNAQSQANGWNPVNVLTDIVWGSHKHGQIAFANMGPNGGVGVTNPSGRGIGPIRTGLFTGSITITINEYVDPAGQQAWWNAGYNGPNAELLLHELAHAYTLLAGSGGFDGTRFISDAKLDSLIMTNCFPGGLF